MPRSATMLPSEAVFAPTGFWSTKPSHERVRLVQALQALCPCRGREPSCPDPPHKSAVLDLFLVLRTHKMNSPWQRVPACGAGRLQAFQFPKAL